MTGTPLVVRRSTEAVCCRHWDESIAGQPGQCRHSLGHVVWSVQWTGSQPSYRDSHSELDLAASHQDLWTEGGVGGNGSVTNFTSIGWGTLLEKGEGQAVH